MIIHIDKMRHSVSIIYTGMEGTNFEFISDTIVFVKDISILELNCNVIRNARGYQCY